MTDSSPAATALAAHRRSLAKRSLASLFTADPRRFALLSLAWNQWLADFSKQHVTADTIALLLAHARERNLAEWIAALLSGPVEFIIPVRAAHPLGDQQALLVASALAQALMTGQSPDALRADLLAKGLAPAAANAQAAHRACPGNRPSTTLLMPEINPRRLGELLALYEHRVFVEGVMFGVDSFDQWGSDWGRMPPIRSSPHCATAPRPMQRTPRRALCSSTRARFCRGASRPIAPVSRACRLGGGSLR